MINCLIVDDEALARKLLTDYIGKIPELNLVGACENPIQAKKVLLENQIDLLFLDIQMPEITGIDFLKTLNKKPLTIFTTAYAEYALEGYTLEIMDYLLKPIPFDRFFQAVSKALDYFAYKNSSKETSPEKPAEQQSPQEYFFAKADYKIVKVKYDDILYIEGMKEYVRIQTKEKKIIIYQSMQKLIELLPSNRFVRIHKSHIINIDKIDSIDNSVVIINNEVLGIGRSYRADFMDKINKRMIN